jgi:prepilin-type N-terminal cleavage/methylation domain-containing protein
MGRRHPRRGEPRERGVSFPELMVVIALLALAAFVAVPIAANRVHEVRVRSAAERFATTLRAARMVAVTSGKPTAVIIKAGGEPTPAAPQPIENSYSFENRGARDFCEWWPLGEEPKCTKVELPPGVWIEPSSASALVFQPNGALDASTPALAVFRARFAGNLETWTIEIPHSGIPTITHGSHPTAE